jgi:hypothetical protein
VSLAFLQRKIERADIVFVSDPVGDRGFGMLRALPAINYLGTDRFTFPKQWRQLTSPAQYDYLDYQYEVLGDIGPPSTNLCAITNQNYEDHTEFTIKPVIAQYDSAGTDATLVVIGDHSDFAPQGGQRKLRSQPTVDRLGTYHDVYGRFADAYEDAGLRCPLADTENLFMQDNANLYRIVTGETLRTVRELFEVLPDAPYLPLYVGMSNIYSRPREPGSSPLDSYEQIKALGRWLRRRVEWDYQTGFDAARLLNRAVAENERVFDAVQPHRDPVADEARERVMACQAESEIHARYADWVTEITT